jgi:hypothetical protein
MRLGVPFIAPRQLGAVESNLGYAILAFCRLAHRTLSGADLFPYLAKPTVGSLGAVGAPDSVRCTPDNPMPPTSRWLGHVSRADCAVDRWPGRPLAHRTVRCTPDSPVNFSCTPLITSREQQVRLSLPDAPDTVRCTTGQSDAPRLSRLWQNKAISFLIWFLLFPALRHNTSVHKTMY